MQYKDGKEPGFRPAAMGRLSRKRKIKAIDPFSKTGGVVPEDPVVAKRRDAPITAKDERREVQRQLLPTQTIPKEEMRFTRSGTLVGRKRPREPSSAGDSGRGSSGSKGPAMPKVGRIQGESLKKYKRRVSAVAKEVMQQRRSMGVTGSQTRKKKQLQQRIDRKAEKALAKEHATALRMLMQGGKAARDGQSRLEVAERKLKELDARRDARDAARQEELAILELEAGKRGAKRLRKQGRLGARSDEHQAAAEDRELQRFLQRRQAEHRVQQSQRGITDAELEGRLAGRIDPAVAGTVREVVARREAARKDEEHSAGGGQNGGAQGKGKGRGRGVGADLVMEGEGGALRARPLTEASRHHRGGGSGGARGPGKPRGHVSSSSSSSSSASSSSSSSASRSSAGGSLVAPSLPAAMLATEVPDASAGRAGAGSGASGTGAAGRDGEAEPGSSSSKGAVGVAALPGEHARELGSGSGVTRAGTASGLWARAQAPPQLGSAKQRLLRQAMASAASARLNRQRR